MDRGHAHIVTAYFLCSCEEVRLQSIPATGFRAHLRQDMEDISTVFSDDLRVKSRIRFVHLKLLRRSSFHHGGHVLEGRFHALTAGGGPVCNLFHAISIVGAVSVAFGTFVKHVEDLLLPDVLSLCAFFERRRLV